MAQSARVAKARDVSLDQVRELIANGNERTPTRLYRRTASECSRTEPRGRRRVPRVSFRNFGEIIVASREFCRPDPEELLRKIEAEEAQSHRGRLKIFVGYAPRVGKSYRMFDEGRRRAARGQDVVVGAVQLKGSEDIAPLLTGFEVIPLTPNGGVDVDAIVRRGPQACLIDELANTNASGSPREHRWQDVEELLNRGINVITAINLQYIAELQPEIEKLTGRRAPRSVPQSFIRSADEIEVIDVPPEDIESGTRRTDAKLTARQLSNLRELALLLAAEVVESQLQRYMDVTASISRGERRSAFWSASRRAARLGQCCRAGRYAADRFHGQLMAVYVKQTRSDSWSGRDARAEPRLAPGNSARK